MIRKVAGGFKLYSRKTGEPLSKTGSYDATVQRERQVQYFKHFRQARLKRGK